MAEASASGPTASWQKSPPSNTAGLQRVRTVRAGLAQRSRTRHQLSGVSGVLSACAMATSPPRRQSNLLRRLCRLGPPGRALWPPYSSARPPASANPRRQPDGGRRLPGQLAVCLARSVRLARRRQAGENILDGGAHFYRCYRCLDGRHLALARWSRSSTPLLWPDLALTEAELPRPREGCSGAIIATVTKIIGTRTRDDWPVQSKRLSEAQATRTPLSGPRSPRRQTHPATCRPPRFASAPDGSGVGPDEPFQPGRSPRIGEHTCGCWPSSATQRPRFDSCWPKQSMSITRPAAGGGGGSSGGGGGARLPPPLAAQSPDDADQVTLTPGPAAREDFAPHSLS
uniref:Peptidase_S24 domain-containing protein n=1 Tax=Macrostomum lignano TaxID=282301 RepID=A0A1I8FEK9_9PLAT